MKKINLFFSTLLIVLVLFLMFSFAGCKATEEQNSSDFSDIQIGQDIEIDINDLDGSDDASDSENSNNTIGSNSSGTFSSIGGSSDKNSMSNSNSSNINFSSNVSSNPTTTSKPNDGWTNDYILN